MWGTAVCFSVQPRGGGSVGVRRAFGIDGDGGGCGWVGESVVSRWESPARSSTASVRRAVARCVERPTQSSRSPAVRGPQIAIIIITTAIVEKHGISAFTRPGQTRRNLNSSSRASATTTNAACKLRSVRAFCCGRVIPSFLAANWALTRGCGCWRCVWVQKE